MSEQGDFMKRKPSRSQYRKRKAEKEKEFQKTKKFMNIDKYIRTKNQELNVASTSAIQTNASAVEPLSGKSDGIATQEIVDEKSRSEGASCATITDAAQESVIDVQQIHVLDDVDTVVPNIADPATWPPIRNSKIIDYIINTGPLQTHCDDYPKNDTGRHFSNSHFIKKLANSETIQRRWLVYSISKDRVYCFCCRLFDSSSTSSLVSEGYNDWKHLSEMLKTHENSTSHKKFYLSWIETELRLKIGKTIDCQEQYFIKKETTRWNNVLSRLMHITLYLAENNMAFRGNSDKLYTPNNGKFLGLVQLLAKFDPVMQEHLRLAMKGDIADHYCGKDIQNELIELMGKKVKSEIISRAKKSKYYSIIADCTPDISHVEQLSLTIRFVDISSNDDKISVKEHFVEFLPVNQSTGEKLTEVIIDILNKHGLELNDCRGQGYDNGANMKGKNVGVQRRILDINPLAVYVPCGCHSYNLVLCDAAKSSVKSVTLFGVLQRLFTLFSASVHRWKILTDSLGLYTLKKLSDTRWEARISSVKAVRYQISAIHDALITLAIETQKTDVQVSHEATTLAEQLKDFSFIVSLVVWYDILFQINVVSKSLQSPDIDLSKCTEMLKKCCTFLEEYRNTGFKSAISTAKELAEELEVEPVFKATKRIRFVKRQADETARDEPIVSPEKKFEVEFFNSLLNATLISVDERFEQFNEYSDCWSFLYNIKQIPEKPDLVKLCSDLQLKLTVNSKSDIDGCMLCDELISLKSFLPDQNVATPAYVLNFIKDRNLQELYPNVWIAFRILLTIPVTVASGERSFSKLKLIKTYLRSTISQSRLTNLATLSIENEIAENMDFECLIKEFADVKARKVKFY
ncbi:unnamed protein product [Chrysodeixis includens]|uniref:TTF-type domain-containing protein n=1 Tax=Chrysodeixis includens TaxID=689277 RepID=A0A9N8Q2I1_CHRIL|nr:unnamed protein product [Chrysodeixis includens]